MPEIEILYENSDFVAVSKPAGMVVHHDIRYSSGTVVDWLLRRYPSIKGVGEDPERPGIVHRLDKDTSGVLIVAKNQETFLFLKKLFGTGRIQKTYTALSVGEVRENRGRVDAPIARSTKNFEKRVVGGRQGRAREAVTEFEVRERFPGFTLLSVTPKTGRTHQIRSHLAHIGHPVACDKLYGGRRYACPAGLGRQFLHAFSLRFTAPRGEALIIEAPLAPDLDAALKQLRQKE